MTPPAMTAAATTRASSFFHMAATPRQVVCSGAYSRVITKSSIAWLRRGGIVLCQRTGFRYKGSRREGSSMKLLPRPVTSSLGSKYVMAITGLLLIGFVLGHMTGNLLIFAGPDAMHGYAAGIKSRPALLWGVRLGLLAVFVVHVLIGIRLTLANKAARPTPYAYEDTLQASWASRHMMLTGLLLLAFVVYHLAHFTLGW